jgi:hypothetical protein
VVIDPEKYTVHDVTGTLKQFLHSLPDPVLTQSLYQNFIATIREFNKGENLWNFLYWTTIGHTVAVLIVGRPLRMFRHTSITCIAASINLIGQRGKLTRQMPRLARKCPVTDCYCEHRWEDGQMNMEMGR